MELLKIATSNQIRSIKILSLSVAEKSKAEDSNVTFETQLLRYKTEAKKVFVEIPTNVKFL